jgi:hypothetical protein
MDQQFNGDMVNRAPDNSAVTVQDEAAYCRWADDGGFCLHPCDQADGFYNGDITEGEL